MLKELFLSLLLAPAVLATPAPGKEIGVRRETIRNEFVRRFSSVGFSLPDVYEPDIDGLCRRRNTPGAALSGRQCLDSSKFGFDCLGHAPDHKVVQRQAACAPGSLCIPIRSEDGPDGPEVALPDDEGNKRIYCLRIDETIKAAKPKKKAFRIKTSLGRGPVSPEGTVYAVLELSGNIKGSHPLMEWKGIQNDRVGEFLWGSHRISNRGANSAINLYPIKVNYDHDAQFFGEVEYLRSDDPDLSLTAYIARFPTDPTSKAADVKKMDTSDNSDVVERDMLRN